MTKTEARRVVGWFRKWFGLRDWNIIVQLQDDPPKWDASVEIDDVAAMVSDKRTETAWIWVSPKRCAEPSAVFDGEPEDPVPVLLHELLHVLMAKSGIEGDGKDRGENAVNRLSVALAALYRLETG